MLQNRLDIMGNRLSDKYKTTEINNQTCFIKDDGTIFNLELIRELNSLVIGYADSLSDAKNYMFEDGDLFPIDMNEDAMFDAMISEIES